MGQEEDMAVSWRVKGRGDWLGGLVSRASLERVWGD